MSRSRKRAASRERRAERWSALDPRTVVGASRRVDRDRARRRTSTRTTVHRVDEAATRDMPATEPVQAIPYEEWVEYVLAPSVLHEGRQLRRARRRRACGCVVLLLAERASGRATNMFTGTLREYRGRGLARAVKLASSHWAAEQRHHADRDRERRDERADARGQPAARLPPARPARRVSQRAGTASSPARRAPVT